LPESPLRAILGHKIKNISPQNHPRAPSLPQAAFTLGSAYQFMNNAGL
jgi:hypothetical protein